ncbi:DUF1996 domain-containing protein [Nocardiopsis nanhaiensis]
MRERSDRPRPERPRPDRPHRGRGRTLAVPAALAVLTLLMGGLALATASGGEPGPGLLVGHSGPKDPGDEAPEEGDGEDREGGQEDGQEGDHGDHGGDHGDGDHGDHGDEPITGPDPEDFAPIDEAPERRADPAPGPDASTGTVSIDCGTNENGVFNSENVIVAPGVEHGAQHTHDYVGNQDVQRFTEDVDTNNAILAEGDTTCPGEDRSMHFWPVLRDVTGESDDAELPGGGLDGNLGSILTPAEARIEFFGNPEGPVSAMPDFLQIFTGNAQAATSEGVNANAQWSCTGFEDQAFPDRYPLCPEGSDVVRILDFPGCWNGRDIESEDNRSHTAFAEEDGTCPDGFTAVPQLRHTLVYDVPEGPNFALDSFPEQGRAPITDHSDHINVMPPELMDQTVECINGGRDC